MVFEGSNQKAVNQLIGDDVTEMQFSSAEDEPVEKLMVNGESLKYEWENH